MTHRRDGRPRAATPRIEGLEGRELLAASVWIADGILNIVGDHRANFVEVLDGEDVPGGYDPARVTVTADGRVYDNLGPVREIRVDLRGGNDQFSYILGDPEASPFGFGDALRVLNVWMGAGNDRVFAGIDGFGYGQDGQQPTSLGPGRWVLNFDLGSGNDRFAMEQYASLIGVETSPGGAVEASDLAVTVRGGAGNDNIDAAIAPVDLYLAYYDVLLYGDAGNDTLNLRSTGDLAIEDATVNFGRYGGAGNDRILGVLTYQSYGDTIVDHEIDGGPGNDQVNTRIGSRTRRQRG